MAIESITTRHWFTAPPGYLVAATDYSSQEGVIAAALSRDENMLAVFRKGQQYDLGLIPMPVDPKGNPYEDPAVDMHIVSASLIAPEVRKLFDETPWLCNKRNKVVKTFRQIGKVVGFLIIYGGQAANLAMQINCTKEEAQIHIDNYFSYPNGFWQLAAWLKAIAHLAGETRWTRLPGGALLYTNEDNAKGSGDKSAAQRKACNGQVQGFASIQSKIAVVKVADEYERLNNLLSPLLRERLGRVTGVVHD